MTTDTLPTGSFLVTLFFLGAVSVGLARRLLACRLCLTLLQSVANPFWVTYSKKNITQILNGSQLVFVAASNFDCKDSMLSASSQCNLPGWRWAAITKVALDRLSRSLHSDVCDSDGCCDAVVHSTISGSGNRRTRAVPNISKEISNAQ